ncbi:alpha/beta hydrolase [Caldifermentibacillus hisashii]|uniref:alpha/beta fold hydrolase n=1 Tax=Bacillaceae TaxID=186817 RepID=UPI0005B72D90|nr:MULTISPECIES: alpha/beta hydrolase [Bacillaceae]MCB5934649.1 alpha/beta hydrolase [Bacillus sp. DFI.2.34]KIO65136.1 hypothetical protein B4065_1080 [Caldibacillus thermoamylovorans]MCB7071317.1 alpha/beta hydrolase [Caldibacillus sp. 210928-DFI.2.22]MCB7074762.1 alpha/beta hydrolase [Caldibacillus sp. 210928-DFI.2.18]MCB7077947.1 alpha/beta hydrolase [Caldibacillus thermoamylovorans]
MVTPLINTKKYVNVREINGIDFYYEHYQNRNATKTLFFIHGFLSSSFSFRYVIPELMDSYEIVSVDFPPFGNSGKTLDFTYSYKNITASLLKLIHVLNLKNVSIIGHSMGGQIGLHMLYQSPETFEKAVLLAGSAYLKQVRKSLIALSYLPFSGMFVKRWLIKSGGVEGNLAKVVYNKSIITDEMVKGYLEPFIKYDNIFRALAKFIRDREDDLPQPILKKIKTPILLVWGDSDKIVPIVVGKRLKNDLPDSELVILPKTGHLIPEERPERTVELIKKFIQ